MADYSTGVAVVVLAWDIHLLLAFLRVLLQFPLLVLDRPETARSMKPTDAFSKGCVSSSKHMNAKSHILLYRLNSAWLIRPLVDPVDDAF